MSALEELAEKKRYYFIGCNSAGNNAYFLKNKYKSIIGPMNVKKGFVSGKYRDNRDVNGELLFSSRESCINAIRGMPVFNIQTNKIEEF